jgi:hypothetical protein
MAVQARMQEIVERVRSTTRVASVLAMMNVFASASAVHDQFVDDC